MQARKPKTRRVRSLCLAALSIALVVVSTGCLTGNIDVKVDKSGSGQVNLEIYPSDELQGLIVAGNLVPVAQNAVSQVRGATFEKITKDGRVGYKVHIPFDDYQQIGPALINGAQVGASNLRVFSTFSLTNVNDQWKLDAVLAPEMLSEALKADPSTQQLIDSGGVSALNSDLLLSIALPGRISSTNGKQVASGTATWALKTNTEATLKMNTVPKPLLTDTQKIFLGAGLAVVVGIFLLVWGSQHSWGHGTERRERKRAKRMKFAGPSGPHGGWQANSPLAPVAEGTRPMSGPMPPRAIPAIGGQPAPGAGMAPGGWADTPPPMPYQVIAGDPPPVAPPVAPVVDPTVPNPFAPHRPGAPLPGAPGSPPAPVPGAPPAAASYGSAPVAPAPAPAPAPQPPQAPYAQPGPLPYAQPAPAPQPPYAQPAPAPQPPYAQAAPPQAYGQSAAEAATAHHDDFYHDPRNELSRLEHKVDEAEIAPERSNAGAAHEPAPALFDLTPDGPAPAMFDLEPDGSTSTDAPWWFEDDSDAADALLPEPLAPEPDLADEVAAGAPVGASLMTPGEPAWASGPESDLAAGESPFSTGSASAGGAVGSRGGAAGSAADTAGADFDDHTDAQNYVATGGGFFDYDTESAPAVDLEDVAAVQDESEGWSGDDTERDAASDTDFEYPSIDGGGGLDFDLGALAPSFEEVNDYPSIDGSGGLDADGAAEADSGVPADWYPDPDDANRFRWWDGVEWTDYVSESGS